MPGIAPQSLPLPPQNLPPWGKILWFIAETVAEGVIYQQFDSAGQITPTGSAEVGEEANTWRRFQLVFANNTSAERADDQVMTFDLVNYTGGTVDSTWTSGDYAAVAGVLETMIQAVKANLWSNLTFSQIRGYVMAFRAYPTDGTPPHEWKTFAESGPPDYLKTEAIACTGTGNTAPQPTSTTTEMTPSRKNWGRFYWPTLSSSNYGVDGRVSAPNVTLLNNAVATAYDSFHAAGFMPVVPTSFVGGSPVRTLQAVTAVRTDDVPDVIRRRRIAHASVVSTWPVP